MVRVGLVDVKDGGSWGPVSTDDGRCRKGHRFSPWEYRAHDEEISWYRWCSQCRWTFTAVPIIAGPHKLNRTLGGFLGMKLQVCLCGEMWPHA
jgi:hypothetical protein